MLQTPSDLGKILCPAAIALALLNSPLRAEPFHRLYGPSLNDIRYDGGLNLAVPLANILINRGERIEISLIHVLETSDYQRTQSAFEIRPFETCVRHSDRKTLAWLRPGGGTVFLNDSSDKLDSAARLGGQATGRDVRDAKWNGIAYSAGQVVAVEDAAKEQIAIEDEGWTLLYRQGKLMQIVTPSGARCEVNSEGKFITSVIFNNKVLVSVDRDDAGGITRISMQSTRYVIKRDASGRIGSIRLEGGNELVSINYGPTGLLSEIRTKDGQSRGVEWRRVSGYEKGNSEYAAPYVLQSVGPNRYDFQAGNGFIRMSLFDGQNRTVLSLRRRNGRLIPQ
jgi:hypothetical protein